MSPDPPDDLIVFDVGHGNAAVYHCSSGCVVIDAGPDSTVSGFFGDPSFTGARYLAAVFISHGDEDHLRGILRLFENNTDLVVGTIFVNPEQQRATALWQSFSDEIRRLEASGTTIVTTLTRSFPGHYEYRGCEFEVLSPPPAAVLTANRASANRWSAVIRISKYGTPFALLTADIDRPALMELLESGKDLTADYLIFPHHGGHPGGADPATFARDLVLAVRPNTVLFSIGRDRFDNPLPSIIRAVNSIAQRRHTRTNIACTQLARACSARSYPDRDVSLYSAGASSGNSCSGTLHLSLQSPPPPGRIPVELVRHSSFVDLLVASNEHPRCRSS